MNLDHLPRRKSFRTHRTQAQIGRRWVELPFPPIIVDDGAEIAVLEVDGYRSPAGVWLAIGLFKDSVDDSLWVAETPHNDSKMIHGRYHLEPGTWRWSASYICRLLPSPIDTTFYNFHSELTMHYPLPEECA